MTTLDLLEFDCELIGDKNLCLRHISIEKIKIERNNSLTLGWMSPRKPIKAEVIIYDLNNLTHSFSANTEIGLRKSFYEMVKIYSNKVEEMP